jgi:hypothetical protein
MTMPLSFASLRARVHLPSIPLSQFSEARNEALALLFASLVFSAVALIVAPNLRDSLLLQLVGVGLGVFTLAVLFLLFRWFFSRTTAQPLLGPWVYTVYLTGSKKPYAHAYAFFTMSRGRLSLNARLCPDASSAARAAQGEKVSSSLADLDSRGRGVGSRQTLDSLSDPVLQPAKNSRRASRARHSRREGAARLSSPRHVAVDLTGRGSHRRSRHDGEG